MRPIPFLSVFAALNLAAGGAALADQVGSKAPEVTPSKWMNTSTKVSWDSLKGRVILVEKWATW